MSKSATNDDNGVLSSDVDSLLAEVSEKLMNINDGCDFKVEPNSLKEENYEPEFNEFVNCDILGDGNDGLESFGHLVTDHNHEDITGDHKVSKVLLHPGIGEVVPKQSIVFIHYVGYILNIPEPFDVTYLNGGRPKKFTLGNGELLPGLELGIKTMKSGEKARFIIHPDYAYQKLGCPLLIPPNTSIIFNVRLVTYFSAENYIFFDIDNRNPKKFKKYMGHIKKMRIEGNELFKLGNLEEALCKYDKAKELLHMIVCNSDKEDMKVMKYLNKLYSNLSLCYIKQCSFNEVCRMGIQAMKYSKRFSKNNPKLFYIWGKALRLLKDFSEAMEKIQRALHIVHNRKIIYELKLLEEDQLFNRNFEPFTMIQDGEEDKRMPPSFWEVFDTYLTQFVDGIDDILTIKLHKNADDVELVKRKASSHNLQSKIVKNAGVETNCIALIKVLK